MRGDEKAIKSMKYNLTDPGQEPPLKYHLLVSEFRAPLVSKGTEHRRQDEVPYTFSRWPVEIVTTHQRDKQNDHRIAVVGYDVKFTESE